MLTTELAVSELSLENVDTGETMPENKFVFWLTLDAPLPAMLNREELRHAGAGECGDYPTYLEHEIVTAFRSFMELGDATATAI